MNYGEKLKYIRTKDLYTQDDVARVLNISRTTYKEYELQYSIIPSKHLNEFANHFNVSIDYIFGLTDKERYLYKRDAIDKKVSGTRIKEFRHEYKLTQQDLANMLNTARSVIADYERGRYLIATPFLYMISKKYNVSADWLLGKIDEAKIK